MVRRVSSRLEAIGRRPALAAASMNFAEVPKSVMPVSSAKSKSAPGVGCIGEPSQSSSVASEASAVTSQFHIIQPQVVK